MKKIVTGLVLLSLGSSMALAGDYYGGVNLDFGKGGFEYKNIIRTRDYDFSQTSLGVHGGYNLNRNSKIELSFKSLTFDFKESGLKDEDGTQFGVDYIYTFTTLSKNKLTPYLGIGLTSNTKDANIIGFSEDSIDGFGLKLRGGAYYSATPHIDIGVEINYNNISWDDLKYQSNDSILEISSSFYGLGLSVNYKF